jgi:alkylated DNA repair dioxygenase AlkB
MEEAITTAHVDSKKIDVQVLRQGLVLIRGAVNLDTQIQIAQSAIDLESMFLKTSATRDRTYVALFAYPEQALLLDIARKALVSANDADETILTDDPTHLLFLKYKTAKGMGFHDDDGENDGAGLNPVVSLSVGNSCDFAVKSSKNDTAKVQTIRLDSGDIIIFGGPCRYILHAVRKVHAGTAPPGVSSVVGNCRLNLTFRHAPEILGREREFEVYTANRFLQSRTVVEIKDMKA